MNIDIFKYNGNQIRTVIKDGEPWFVAKDVCEIIEIKNVSDTLGRLDDDEKGIDSIDTHGGIQDMVTVNEPGLYSLILGSRKPEAKAFKRWITHEVIPTIRKTGRYESKPLSQLEIAQIAITQLIEQEKKLKEHDSRLEQLENKIEKRITDDFSMQLITPTQIGKMFEPALSGKAVNQMLQKAGLQWRVGGEWVATVDSKQYSSSEPIQLPNGKMEYQLKWQRRVKDMIQSENGK